MNNILVFPEFNNVNAAIKDIMQLYQIKNSTYDSKSFVNAMEELTKKEFNAKNIYNWNCGLEQKEFINCTVNCLANKTYIISYVPVDRTEKIKANSFSELIKALKDNELNVNYIKNRNRLNFEQFSELVRLNDIKPDVLE